MNHIVGDGKWVLLFLFFVELTAKIGLNQENLFSIVRNHETFDEISRDQRGTALLVAGLVFAGLTLILSNSPTQYTSQIENFIISLGLLLIAAFAHELTLTYRIVLTMQEMALEYGLLFVLFALSTVIFEFVPDATIVTASVLGCVLIFRFVSVIGELEAHYQE